MMVVVVVAVVVVEREFPERIRAVSGRKSVVEDTEEEVGSGLRERLRILGVGSSLLMLLLLLLEADVGDYHVEGPVDVVVVVVE